MIIDQVEALKSWLTLKLSPICDAEPSALAKYVCALVKKDKPEQDLKDICLDQLDVFLQSKTKPFVDELFESLKSKSYIPPAEKKAAPVPSAPARNEGKVSSHQGDREKDDSTKKKSSEISSTTEDKEAKDPPNSKDGKERESAADTGISSKDSSRDIREQRALSREGRDRDGERDRRDSWKDERGRDGIRDARDIIRERERDGVRDRDTREVREPRDRDHRDRDRDFRRRRTRSRSFSPRRRDFDDRIPRRRYDDRPRYSPDRRWGRKRSWSRSPRRRSPLGRLRSRSPRLRSRSPRLRSRSPRDRYRSFRSRTRSRSRSPGPHSWSRPGSASGGRARSPSNIRQPDSRGSTPVQDNDYSTLISSSTNDLPAITSTVGLRPARDEKPDNRLLPDRPLSLGHGPRARCINFEEKGYCILGDMCPYDHGTNPVVVEDVPMPNVVPGGRPMPGPPNAGPGFVPPDLRIPPPGHMAIRMNIRPPPPNLVEPYMPEAPGLREPLRPPLMRSMGPHVRPPPPRMMMGHPPPDQMFPPQREVIMAPLTPSDSDDLDTLIADKEPSRIVIPAKRPYSAIGGEMVDPNLGPPPPRMAHINQNHHMFAQRVRPSFQPRMNQPGRKGFDYNRLGGGFRQGSRPPFKTGNLTLEVRKIPPEMNNIAKINEHFGKFGNLTNIQVKFQGDPGAALITFSNNGEATAAYKSPEPVFNNRFIKLFWHDSSKTEEGGDKDAEGKEDGGDAKLRSGGRVGDGINHPSLVLPLRSTIPPASKLQLDNTKPKVSGDAPPSSSEPSSGPEQSFVYSSSLGHLKKTVHNAGATVPAKAIAPLTSPTTAKPSDFVSRIEAIKRAEENKKQATVKQAELDAKKQDLLAKQIQQQKLLIETLDKKKGTMSEKERANLLKALKMISDAIDKVKYSTGTKKPSTFQAPAPAQLRFVSQEQAHAKEMQDLEQEVMTRQKRGEDTTALRMKLMELANKQQSSTFSYGRGRGWASHRGTGWAPRGRGRSAMATMGRTSLDNRPKTLEVKNFELEEIEEIKAHFQQFGELDRVELMEDPPSLWITFANRPSAEMALTQGAKFNNKVLAVKWFEAQKLQQRESIQSSELDDEDLSVSLGSIEEEALMNFKSEDKSASESEKESKPSSAPETTGDSRSVVTTQDQDQDTKTVAATSYQRSLSEDLILGDEQNFKASYTDDEEEDDHITVTVSTTVNSGSWVYAKSGATLEDQPAKEEEADDVTDLDNLVNSEITFTEDDGSSWA